MSAISPELLEILMCPACRDSGLEDAGDRLRCPKCGAEYPVEDGIPRLLPPELAAAEAKGQDADTGRKRQEMAARDDQAKAYDRMVGLKLFGSVEIPATTALARLDGGGRLLEAGCGTGRMTAAFARGATRVTAMDFSMASLRACAARLRAAGIRNVDLLQGDVCSLPFRPGVFHRVVSCQVLEHIPSAKSRDAMLAGLARVAEPGGRIVLSAYQYNLVTRWFGPREGEHAGGIYYYRFRRAELRALLSRFIRLDRFTGALLYHFMAAGQALPTEAPA